MTPRVVIQPAAQLDLDDHAEYLLFRTGIDTAARWYDATAATFAFLSRAPMIAPVRQTRKAALVGIRMWAVDGFPKHIVFYLPIADGIEVVRVLHGARDVDRVLEGPV